MKGATPDRFWAITGLGAVALLIVYVTVIAPTQSRVRELRKELETVAGKLEQYHRRGKTVLNDQWLQAAELRIEEVEAHFEKTRDYFRERQAGEDGFAACRIERGFDSPVEFKVAYEYERGKLVDSARKARPGLKAESFQFFQFKAPASPSDYSRLFEELWLQRELAAVLGRAGIEELTRIRLPGAPSSPPEIREEPAGSGLLPVSPRSMAFRLECLVSPTGFPGLLNELVSSQANVAFERLTVSAVPSRDSGKVPLRLSIEATAFPALP